jgi:hypothetical protein
LDYFLELFQGALELVGFGEVLRDLECPFAVYGQGASIAHARRNRRRGGAKI